MRHFIARIHLSATAAVLVAGALTLATPCKADPASLYLTHCAECHGLSGKADGPAAKTLGRSVTALHGVDRSAIEKAILEPAPSHRGHGIYQRLTRAELLELITEVQSLAQH